MSNDIKKVVEILKTGGIVIFPTDTAFGIGCRIDDEKAVKRLFRVRKRPETKATPVLISSLEMVQKYLELIPENVIDKLIELYWPGALTIVLKCKTDKFPSLVRGGGATLGVRMPDHSIALELIEQVGIPIIGTSANFAGGKTPYKFEDLDPELVNNVDYALNGECNLKQASTVIDCSVEPWEVLRQGALKLDNI